MLFSKPKHPPTMFAMNMAQILGQNKAAMGQWGNGDEEAMGFEGR